MSSVPLTHLHPHSTITDQEIGPLLKSYPNLSSLNISYCTLLTAKGIQTIALSLWDKQLVSLKIAHCKNPSIQAEDWLHFVQLIDFSKIQALDLSNVSCDFTSNQPMEQFANIRPATLLETKIKGLLISHFNR